MFWVVMIWEHVPEMGQYWQTLQSLCLYLAPIFLHSYWIWRDTEDLSMFSPNAKKCRPNTDTFHSINIIKKYLWTKKLSPYMNKILVKIFPQKISLHMINRFGGRYFCLTERYSVSLRIQFECVKVRTRITFTCVSSRSI